MAKIDVLKDWSIVHSYSRQQAIDDGELVALPDFTNGKIRMPIAVTRAVYQKCIATPDPAPPGQDIDGRIHDFIWMARFPFHLLRGTSDCSTWLFRAMAKNHKGREKPVTLKAHFGPGDKPQQTVLTIMMPHED